jgi:MFS family permease
LSGQAAGVPRRAGRAFGVLVGEVGVDRCCCGQPCGRGSDDLRGDVREIAGHPHPGHAGRAGGVRLDLVIETRAEAPLLPLRLFRLKTLAGSNAVGFLLGASFFAFIFIATLYMQQVLGYSALKTGFAWLAASLTSVALAGVSQMLVTRASAKLVMAAGMVLIGAGILWATRVPVHGNFWADLAGPFLVTGAGTAFTFIPVSIGALAGVTERDAGVASGLLNTSQQLGGAIGVAVASTIAATHAGTLLRQGAAPPAALTSGFQWAFWACGAIGLAAVPVTFLLVRRHELATAVAGTSGKPQPAPAEV